jgi:hypothetical protein
MKFILDLRITIGREESSCLKFCHLKEQALLSFILGRSLIGQDTAYPPHVSPSAVSYDFK